jgi:hypothetical protein
MSHSVAASSQISQGPRSRSAGTPHGFRNVRVLVPTDLHWKLRQMAAENRKNFQDFLASVLAEAIPLNPIPGTTSQAKGPGPESTEGS